MVKKIQTGRNTREMSIDFRVWLEATEGKLKEALRV